MILQILNLLFVYLFVPKKEEPARLDKKQQPINLKDFNWTFIILALALTLFFVLIFVFQVGNSYPNDLMNGSVNV